MTAEHRRAAGRDRADDAPLDSSQMSGVRLNVDFAVAAKDIASSNAGRAVTGYSGGVTLSSNRSSGLSVLAITCDETRV